MPLVTLYSRPGCRLCDEAKRELATAVPKATIVEVDVDSDPGLRERYGLDIPVAIVNGRELFRHRFDPTCVALIRNY